MRRLLLLVSAIVFVDTAFFAAITPLLPAYVEEFGLSKSSAGVLVAAYPAGTMLGSLPAGWFAARAGVRPSVLLGLLLLAGSSFAFAFAPSIELLDSARFVQGLGSAASWAGALGWLVGAAPRERRGELIGSAFGTALVGALCGPVVGGAADHLGPELVFSAVGCAAGVLATIAARTPAVAPVAGAGLRSLVGALREWRVSAGAGMVGLVGLMFGTIGVLAPLRLDELGAAATAIAATFLVGGIFEAAMSPAMGRLSDRAGPLVPALAGLAGGGVAMALLPWPGSAGLLIALLVVTSPTIGSLWTPATMLLSEGAEVRGIDQALGFSLMNLAWSIGETAGSAGSARLAEAAGDPLPYLLLAGACAAGVVGLRRVGPRAGARALH
jgi:predicted MFS family arabinose efflux permease